MEGETLVHGEDDGIGEEQVAGGHTFTLSGKGKKEKKSRQVLRTGRSSENVTGRSGHGAGTIGRNSGPWPNDRHCSPTGFGHHGQDKVENDLLELNAIGEDGGQRRREPGYPNLILTPWVLGRRVLLEVYGPPGITHMTGHVLEAYRADCETRSKH
jgi:hypothetical protein